MTPQQRLFTLCLAATAAAIAITVLVWGKETSDLPPTVTEKPSPASPRPPRSPGKKPAEINVFPSQTTHTAPGIKEQKTRPDETALETTAQLTGLLDDENNTAALKEIRDLCRHSDREVRIIVAEAISWIGVPAAMEAAAMIDDPDEEIRTMARETFWQILHDLDDVQLKKQLLTMSLDSNDPSFKLDALDELLYLPDDIARELLKKAANDSNVDVVNLARENLSFIGENL